jgi:hypothetical protein
MEAKNISIYNSYVAMGADMDSIGVYTNAEMEYRAADSRIISIAVRGWRLVPGIRDTIRIRKMIIAVHIMAVTRDRDNELTSTAWASLSGIKCGTTAKPKIVIPRAEIID